MKRGWAWLLAAGLLLTGCAGGGEQETAEEEVPQTEQTVQEEALDPAPEGLTMELEHEVYDPSLTSYTYFIYNNTDQMTGTETTGWT